MRALRHPAAFWIAAAALSAAVAVALWQAGRTAPRIVNDSTGYTQFEFAWPAFLAQRRTPGYPLVLAAAGGRTAAMPWVHVAVYAGGAAAFAAAVVGGGIGRRLLVAAALLSANILWLYVDTVATDTVAAGLGLLTMAAAFRAGRGSRGWIAAAVGLATVAWLVRPTMLALVVAAPAAAYFAAREDRPRRTALRPAAVLFAGAAAVVLAWCGLRWAALGDFGAVSFGGHNLIGIAGQFPEADGLSTDDPELGAVRDAAAAARAASEPAMAEAAPMNYLRLENNHDATIWRLYEPPARERSADYVAADRLLARHAAALIRHAPWRYAEWLAKATRQAVRGTFDGLASNLAGLALILAVFAGTCVGPGMVGLRTRTLTAVAVTYWAGLTAVTVLVVPPRGRMTDAAGLLLMAVLASATADLWTRRR